MPRLVSRYCVLAFLLLIAGRSPVAALPIGSFTWEHDPLLGVGPLFSVVNDSAATYLFGPPGLVFHDVYAHLTIDGDKDTTTANDRFVRSLLLAEVLAATSDNTVQSWHDLSDSLIIAATVSLTLPLEGTVALMLNEQVVDSILPPGDTGTQTYAAIDFTPAAPVPETGGLVVFAIGLLGTLLAHRWWGA